MVPLRTLYQEAIIHDYKALAVLIDFLVKEKKVLKMDDDCEKLNYYFQPKFKNKMNEYLYEHAKKKGVRFGS